MTRIRPLHRRVGRVEHPPPQTKRHRILRHAGDNRPGKEDLRYEEFLIVSL